MYSCMAIGKTGTGKHLLQRNWQGTSVMKKALVRFDMSEFS